MKITRKKQRQALVRAGFLERIQEKAYGTTAIYSRSIGDAELWATFDFYEKLNGNIGSYASYELVVKHTVLPLYKHHFQELVRKASKQVCDCRKPTIDSRVYRNVDTYKIPAGGGSVLARCQVCKKGVVVRGDAAFSHHPYVGKETEDDWGNELAK